MLWPGTVTPTNGRQRSKQGVTRCLYKIFLPILLYWETRNTSRCEAHTVDTNVLHKIQERLDIEEVRVLGPVELE